MRYKTTIKTILAFIITGVAIACEGPALNNMPYNLAQYRQMGKSARLRYHDESIIDCNVSRVCNPEHSEKVRLDSLDLLLNMGATKDATGRVHREDVLSYDHRKSLASTLRATSKTPPRLKRKILKYLLEKRHPNLGAFATAFLRSKTDLQDPTVKEVRRLATNYFLTSNTNVASILDAWAKDLHPTAEQDESFRSALEMVTKKRWDESLLDAIVSSDVPQRLKPRVWEILARQKTPADLKQMIKERPVYSDMSENSKLFLIGLKTFLDKFDFLPTNKHQFLYTVILYKKSLNRDDLFSGAVKMHNQWKREFDYKFNIYDYHLLSRMKRDPIRKSLKRHKLEGEIGKVLTKRKHLPCKAVKTVKFWTQVDNLSMADLWNIYLLNDMFSKPRTLASFVAVADYDRKRYKNCALAGLIFYQNSNAVVEPFEPDEKKSVSDLKYAPSRLLVTSSRDSLCRYICHFERVKNAKRAGPTKEELKEAMTEGWNGLIITQVDKNHFAAHYFNPKGIVISLGILKAPSPEAFR